MAYYDLFLLAFDGDFFARIEGCVASEGAVDPPGWADEHRWAVAASPTFADRYASALVSGVPNPGRDPAVIPDADLLAAVQAIAVEP
jgi:hypothetical protein